ncbi:Pex19-domain-containing protein [Trametopsis cervina]|nr:Pex19-domain-containing protein [Trametopsis cervina]
MSTAQNKKPATVDEDVDDLDDVLEQFGTASKTAPSATAPSAPAGKDKAAARKLPAGLEDLDVGEDFARELAEGMAALMRELAVDVGDKPEDNLTGKDASLEQAELEREAAFRKAWEDMLVEDMNGALNTEDFGATGKGKTPAKPGETAKTDVREDAFQASIKKAMDKLKQSDSALHADSAASDPFEALLSQLGEDGTETEEQLQGMLENMMAQLMGKDVLYEPLKELHEKFPKYLEDNAETLSAEDKKRYNSQQRLVVEILAVFDSPSYSPDNEEQGIKIVTMMNKMQEFGSPPQELMGELPPGMETDKDGMPKLPNQCTIA